MGNHISIDNTSMALVILIIFCYGDPDLLDVCIKFIGALAELANSYRGG